MKKETALMIWLAFTIGIFDGLFGIDTIRYKMFTVEYQSFWGAFFSLYYIIGILLIYGKKILKDKLMLVQTILISLIVYNLAEFIHRLDAVRLGFITKEQLLGMRYEFTGFFGHTISFSSSDLLLLYLSLSVVVVAIELYKRRKAK
jgi:hypothetical protein